MDNKYIGMLSFNSHGTPMKIIEYFNKKNVIIEFQDEHRFRKKVGLGNFRRGNVSNPFDRTILDCAYIGNGDYCKEKHTSCYIYWHNMLIRCFSEKYKTKYPTYKNVTVCNEWLNFQNFAKWYYQNFYCIDGERMELDKDILQKGNKIYSSEKCVFIPRRINSLLINNKQKRGKYPIGVDFARGKYRARYNDLGNSIFVGDYDNPEDAFLAYKQYKEKYIKKVADSYKHLIPAKLYNALYDFKIERND